MILVDTSAWIEFLRGTTDPVVPDLRQRIARGDALAMTEPVGMELLAGVGTSEQERRVNALVDGLPLLPIDARIDYRAAARLSLASRRNGHPIRSMIDCLIAAVAIRREVPLLHRDRDYDYLAEISPLVTL